MPLIVGLVVLAVVVVAGLVALMMV
ncbi:hypothetical protein ACTIVE_5200 [Actinomadura verrucosospora]|uniref:Uncharacterized protein n=2 Tax=Actinomadura verrucosospora TaxID=46165 RepID=A0A7D3ZHA1_ACTVE|nr:hypothetical protein ACTIVE_5200 [Actinomadura verrucosospora]